MAGKAGLAERYAQVWLARLRQRSARPTVPVTAEPTPLETMTL
jgi:hypothetical protein